MRGRRLLRGIPLGRLAIVVQGIAAIAFVAYLFGNDHVRLPFSGSGYQIRAAFDDASGLNSKAGHPVMIAGVRVGEVTDVSYEHGAAVATMRLDDGVRGRLRRDARAYIEPRSALQDQTVELVPGHAREPLDARSPIPADRTQGPIELDQLVSTLDADTRAQVQILLGGLRTGLQGRSGALRADLAELARAMDSTGRVARALADRRRLLRRLVGQLDVTFATLAQRRDRLGEVLSAGQRTMQTTAARSAELEGTMRELPGTLAELGGALDAVRTLTGSLAPALDGLRPAARSLPGGLAALRAFVPAARGLIADLAPVVREGGPPARDLRAALEALGPAAAGLRDPLRRLGPVLEAIDAKRAGIPLLAERFSGIFSTNDPNGPILRGLGFFEPFDPANVGAPGARGARREELARLSVRALLKACETNGAACLARYLIPGLPGALRTAAQPLGDAAAARAAATRAGGGRR